MLVVWSMIPMNTSFTLTLLAIFMTVVLSCTDTMLDPVSDSKTGNKENRTETDSSMYANDSEPSTPALCGDAICDAHAFCGRTEGVSKCICKEGWSGDGTICVDIDECALDQNNCDIKKGVCTNLEGGYLCDCKDGWSLQPDGATCAPPPFRYKQVVAGTGFTCALKTDDTISCFGDATYGQAVPYDALYTQIAAEQDVACGLTHNGTVFCWGDCNKLSGILAIDNNVGYFGDRQFKSITMGYDFICGIQYDDRIYCTESDTIENFDPSDIAFDQIDAEAFQVCGVTKDEGTARCWNETLGTWNTVEFEDAGDTTFKTVSVSQDYACGILSNDTVRCWGQVGEELPPDDIRFKEIVTDNFAICGITYDDEVSCWGYNGWHEFSGAFQHIVVSEGYICGIDMEGNLYCDGSGWHGEASPPETGYIQVSAGASEEQCGLKRDGTIHCLERLQMSAPQEDGFTQVVVGTDYACAIGADKNVTCWGDDATLPPEGQFLQIDLNTSNVACGITGGHRIRCWGNESLKDSQNLFEGAYRYISVGDNHICAIKSSSDDDPFCDGEPECHGDNTQGKRDPLFGHFNKIAAAGDHTCALRDDATIACWGDIDYESTDIAPPDTRPQTFIDLTTAQDYFCTIATDGLVDCQRDAGSVEYQLVPGGSFIQISAADDYVCGVKRDGTLSCWGSIAR